MDNFICIQCNKTSNKIGSGNIFTDPFGYRCEKCAIINYAGDRGIKSLEVAESYRRRIFDVFYLFQEMLIDIILKKEKKKFKELTDEEYQRAIELANDIWMDKKVISMAKKKDLEHLYYQEDIEEEIEIILNNVSLHRVDIKD